MLFPVITAQTGMSSSARAKIPMSVQGPPQPRLRFLPLFAGMTLLTTLNLAEPDVVVAAPSWPKSEMIPLPAFGTSRIVLLLIVMLPCVFWPCTTARMPLPNPDPESFTPCVPMEFPSIFPTWKWLAGPVSAPAAVNVLIAWLLAWPDVAFGGVNRPTIVLLRIWKASFDCWAWLMSTPTLLPEKVLLCTVKLFEATGATMAPPEALPIRPVSPVTTCAPVARTPVNVLPLIEPLASTDVPRMLNRRPSLPSDPDGWHGWPLAHETVSPVIVNDVML